VQGHETSAAIHTRRMQRFLIGFSLFVIPYTLAVCLIGMLVSHSWYAFAGLSGLLFPAMVFWYARPMRVEETYHTSPYES
jgi:hypothetical protein